MDLNIHEFYRLLEQFAELLERQQIERLKKQGLGCQTNIDNCKVKVKAGKKYFKVDVGSSGKYMVDREGHIYGIKAYGQVHKGHCYGTLETVHQYYWGNYQAEPVNNVNMDFPNLPEVK